MKDDFNFKLDRAKLIIIHELVRAKTKKDLLKVIEYSQCFIDNNCKEDI